MKNPRLGKMTKNHLGVYQNQDLNSERAKIPELRDDEVFVVNMLDTYCVSKTKSVWTLDVMQTGFNVPNKNYEEGYTTEALYKHVPLGQFTPLVEGTLPMTWCFWDEEISTCLAYCYYKRWEPNADVYENRGGIYERKSRKMSRKEKRKRKRMRCQYERVDLRVGHRPVVYDEWFGQVKRFSHFDAYGNPKYGWDEELEETPFVACTGCDIPGYHSEDNPYESEASVDDWSSAEASSYVDSDGNTLSEVETVESDGAWQYDLGDVLYPYFYSPISSLHSSDIEDYDSENDVLLYANGARSYGSVVVTPDGNMAVSHDEQFALVREELSLARVVHRRLFRLVMGELGFMVDTIDERYYRGLHRIQHSSVMLDIPHEALFRECRRSASRIAALVPEASFGLEDAKELCKTIWDPLAGIERQTVALIEQLACLAYSCHNCKDMTGIAAGVSCWLLTRYGNGKSLFIDGYQAMVKILGDGDTDIFSGVASFFADQSVAPSEPPPFSSKDPYAKESGYESSAGFYHNPTNGGAANGETLHRFLHLLSTLGTMGMCSVMGYQFDFNVCTGAYQDVYNFVSKLSVVETIGEHVTYFIRTGWQAYDKKDPWVLLGGNERSNFVQRIVDVETAFKELASGWREMDIVTKKKLEKEIEDLGVLSRKYLKQAIGPALKAYEVYAERVANFALELKRLSAVGRARVEPMTFLVYAHSGQGKTNFINATTTGMLNAYEPGSANGSSIQISVGMDKYDNMSVGKPILVHEELGAVNPDKALDPGAVIGQIQRTINPTGVVGVYADLHDKGSLLQAFKIVAGTTNVKDLWMTTLAGDPGAVMRRWNYVISIEAKSGYCVGGILKNWLVPEGASAWHITIETVNINYKRSAVTANPTYTHEGAKFNFQVVEEIDAEGKKTRMEKVDFNVAFDFMCRKYKEHADNQRDWTRAEDLNVALGVCPHRKLFKYCSEVECSTKLKEAMAIHVAQCEANKQPFQSLHERMIAAVASTGEEGVEEEKEEVDDIDFKHRAHRTFTSGYGLTPEEFKRYMGLLNYPMTLTTAKCVMGLRDWHRAHACEQGVDFFASDERTTLHCYFLHLAHTRFVKVRAPWITCKFQASDYDLVIPQREYENGKADQSMDVRSYAEFYNSYERKRLSREFDKAEKEHPHRVRFFTWMCDKLGVERVGKWVGYSSDLKKQRAKKGIFSACMFVYVFVAYITFKLAPLYVAFLYLCGSSTVLYGANWWLSLLVTYGTYIPCMQGELRVAVLYLKAREMCKQKYAKILLGVGVALAASKLMYTLLKKKDEIDRGFESCGSAFARPTEIRPGFADYYQVPVSDFKKYNPTNPTSTLEQKMLRLEQQLMVIRFSTPGVPISTGLVSFQDCLHSGSCIITNAHPFNGLGEGEWMEVEIARDKEMGPHKQQKITLRNIVFFGNDLAAVYVNGLQPARNLFVEGKSLFPEIYPDVSVDATWVYRDTKSLEIVKQKTKMYARKVTYKESRHGKFYNYQGHAFKVKTAKQGQCMALLIGHVSPVTVLGVHVAGRIGETDAFSTCILRPEAVAATEELQKRFALPLACVGDELEVDPYDMGYALSDLTKDTCINFIPEGVRVSAVVHGQIPGMVPRSVRMGDASYTSIGVEMEKMHPEFKVSVPRNLHRNGFIMPLRQASTSSTSINPIVAARAMAELKKFVVERVAMAEEEGEVSIFDAIHPIPIDAVLNDKVSGFNIPDLTKSAGYGLPGKKSLYVEVDSEGHKELDPRVVARVNLLIERAKKKIMSRTIHSASLKKELLPTAKCRPPGEPKVVYTKPVSEGEIYIEDMLEYKVRMFAGCSFEYLVACKMYFGMLLRFFTLHSIIFGMAFGINPHSYDFTAMTKRWKKFEKNILAGDYKKFDKKLDSTVTCAGAEIILFILGLAGYTEEQLTICGMLLLEVMFPTYVWAGVVVTLAQSSPSGHPMTAFKNNWDNRFALTYCWYAIFGTEEDAPSFNDNVELNMMGDDHIGTVRKGFERYNCMMIATVMTQEIGIEYTTADKRKMDVLYEDFETVEYLKMRAHWDDELEVYKPWLNKASIYKMVTKTLAEFTPGSIAMDEHTYQVCQDALIHMYYYGEKDYNAFVDELELCFLGVKYRSLDAPSYDMQNEAYKRRLADSNSVRYTPGFVKPLSWVENPIYSTDQEEWFIHEGHVSVRPVQMTT